MDEFVKAVGQLLLRCGEASQMIGEKPGNCHLWNDAQAVKDLLPNILPDPADRPDAESAALLLLAAGNRLRGGMNEGGDTREWDQAQAKALDLLGIVPLTPAGK